MPSRGRPSGASQTVTAEQPVPTPTSGRLVEDVTGPRDLPVGRAGQQRRPPSRPRVPLTGPGVFDLLKPSRRADAPRGAVPLTTYTVEVERTLPFPAGVTARHVTPRWTTLAAEVPSSTSTSRRYREALTYASSSPPPAPPTGWHAVADPRPGLVPQRAPGSDQCAAVGSRHPRLPRAPRAHRRYVANHEVGHSASGTRSALRRVTWHRSCSSKRTDCADASVTRGPAPAERTTPSA